MMNNTSGLELEWNTTVEHEPEIHMACCHTGCGYEPEMTDIYIWPKRVCMQLRPRTAHAIFSRLVRDEIINSLRENYSQYYYYYCIPSPDRIISNYKTGSYEGTYSGTFKGVKKVQKELGGNGPGVGWGGRFVCLTLVLLLWVRGCAKAVTCASSKPWWVRGCANYIIAFFDTAVNQLAPQLLQLYDRTHPSLPGDRCSFLSLGGCLSDSILHGVQLIGCSLSYAHFCVLSY